MTGLEKYIRQKEKEKSPLVMTHQLLGYPSFSTNLEAIKIFVERKVDIIELQIPFSDPVADGPLFVRANQKSIEQGTTVDECFRFVEKLIGEELTEEKIPILLMTYYNIVYSFGEEKFLKRCKEIGVAGLIIPDAPIEECPELYFIGKQLDISIPPIGTPVSSMERLRKLTTEGGGFLYYVPRKGVTGYKTDFEDSVLKTIDEVEGISALPLAVGFGVQTAEDLNRLKGHCSIVVIGSELMRALDSGGIEKLDKKISEIMEVL